MYTSLEECNNKLFHFYYDKSGTKRIECVDFKPTIGLETTEQTPWRTLDNRKVKPVQFDSITEFKNFYYNNQHMNLYNYIEPSYQFIHQHYGNFNYDLTKIKCLFLDIEVYSEDGFPSPSVAAWPITSISIKDQQTKRYYVLATKDYDRNNTILDIDPKTIWFKKCENDQEILKLLGKILKNLKPDIICGWNSDGFDFPYIINRFDYIFDDEEVKECLSLIKHHTSVYTQESIQKVGTRYMKSFKSQIRGINLFDYMRLYRKFVFTPRSSYSLDHISEVELGSTKIDYSEYDNLNDLWNKNPQKYIDYNIYDVELIDKLNDKLGLIDLAMTIAYDAGVRPIDVMGTTKVWDVIFYNRLNNNKIMTPPFKENEKEKYAGAYVKDPVPGIYDWIVSYDLNSLYPHLQQQFNISPECLVQDEYEAVGIDSISDRLLKKEIKVNPKYILAGNGHYFRKDIQGFIPTILREMYNERATVKKTMLIEKQILENLKNELALRT